MTTLEMIVDRNIRTRHVLVCGMSDARRSIASLRRMRAMPEVSEALARRVAELRAAEKMTAPS